MKGLSVVVAGAAAGAGGRSLPALLDELEPGDQLLWVGPECDMGEIDVPAVPTRSGARRGGACVTAVRSPAHAGRGERYRLGLNAAEHDAVAFTDSLTQVAAGWRAAAVEGLAAGAAVVGGPVLPSGDPSLRTIAGFLVEYGAHATAPYTSATGDVAANNVAYRRAWLERVLEPGEPLWKSVVSARLRASGTVPVVLPAMRVLSLKRYAWHDLCADRVEHGRLYGAQRAGGWGAPRRVGAALACAGLPALALARLAVRLRRDRALVSALTRSCPLVALALVAWSAGEAVGYLTGTGNDHAVF